MPSASATAAPSQLLRSAGYHHGDLRRGLIDAAITILDETQRWDFSQREVARLAGVSHNAPSKHFSDRRALLAAVASEGYARLRGDMLAASRNTPDTGEALRAIGTAYIRFGIKNPAFYRLMFGSELQSETGLPEDVIVAAEASRSVLRDVIRRGGEDGTFDVDQDDPASIVSAVLAAWAMIHGFTLLAIDGLARLETSLEVEELARMISFRFRQGLAPR